MPDRCFIFLFLTVIVLFITDVKGSCPSNCTCANSIMDCRSQKWYKFPATVGDDIKAIYMNDNLLTSLGQIPEEAELQTLVLSGNKISKLDYDTFDNLDNLKTLYLSNNSIQAIADDIFEWNPLKLEVLYLDGNKLEFIQHFLFYDLEELTDLFLQNNMITFIHPHAFLQLKNLRNLRLDGNRLHTFSHKWINKLQPNMFAELRFDNNPWSCDCAMNHSIGWLKNEKEARWFRDLTLDHQIVCATPAGIKGQKLESLTTDKLNERCDMPRITGISTPTTLKLGQNVLLRCVWKDDTYPIPTISWTAPNKDVYRLNTAVNYDGITVHQNGSLLITNLSSIDNGSYTCTATNYKGSHSATTKLIVRNDTRPQTYTKVELRPTEAPDKNVKAVANKGCPKGCQCISRHIDCSGDGSNSNTLPRIAVPSDIPDDAVTISLAGNELKKIGAHDFKSFTKLEELRLDDNQIATIHSNAFNSLDMLTTLTLQENKLTKIPDGTFSKLQNLNVLVLDKNQLTVLTKGMFKGLESLQWLYIRHNDLESIAENTFDYLKKVKFIHLEANMLRSLPATEFPLSPQLKKLFVDDNNFQCDSEMEDVRAMLRKPEFLKKKPNFYGDGIICSYPPEYKDMQLNDTKVLRSPGLNSDTTSAAPLQSSSYSGLLVGGIALGAILTVAIIIIWRKYGRTVRTKGRSYNYSDLRGNDDSERSGLTDGMGSSGQEAFV